MTSLTTMASRIDKSINTAISDLLFIITEKWEDKQTSSHSHNFRLEKSVRQSRLEYTALQDPITRDHQNTGIQPMFA